MTVEQIPFRSQQPPPKPFRITKAAVRYGDVVYIAWRHSTILIHMHFLHGSHGSQDDQGFVDAHGNWYNRYQSARIAYRARQIAKLPPVMTSEDLWDKDGNPRVLGEPYSPLEG
jgi:hypothetical protein